MRREVDKEEGDCFGGKSNVIRGQSLGRKVIGAQHTNAARLAVALLA